MVDKNNFIFYLHHIHFHNHYFMFKKSYIKEIIPWIFYMTITLCIYKNHSKWFFSIFQKIFNYVLNVILFLLSFLAKPLNLIQYLKIFNQFILFNFICQHFMQNILLMLHYSQIFHYSQFLEYFLKKFQFFIYLFFKY